MSIDIQSSRLGGKVIEARNLTKSFGDKKIVEHFNYSLKAGDRIGIVGPNGIGKSTFIDLLTKRSEPDAGKVTIGDTVVLSIFGQQGLQLKEDQRILDVVRDIAELIPLSKGKSLTAAQLLERFLFDKEKQYQYVSPLSGGEKRRLHLCTVLMKTPNVLVLDEPTNDLDIPTLTALEDFLTDLNICLLIVSHDRFFMDKLCTKLLVFEGNGVVKEWVHSYTELRDYQRELASRPTKKVEAPVEAAPTKKKASGKMTFAERNELKKIDKDLPTLEKKKEELAAEMLAKAADHHAIMQLSIDLEKVTTQLDTLGERWLVLMEKVEGE
ncbi:MAG: ABC-F family ATP-binding cassette domain-containing protein [Flavobacteriales bacterium]|nr:ABC-F family ATP-binding cassette domain-containing protein [Flavobacteriales bacterium]